MRVRKGIALGLIVGVAGVMIRPTSLGLRLEEEIGLPWLFAMRGPVAPPAEVAVVSVDKASAQQVGIGTTVWPPSRDVHARIVDRLARERAAIVVMDVWLGDHRTPAEDAALAQAMAAHGSVVLVQRVDRPRVPGMDVETELLQSPIAEFQQSVRGLAPFPLPRHPLTSSFWSFFESSAGTVPTLPAVALQLHASGAFDRFVTLLEDAGFRDAGQLPRQAASAGDIVALMQRLRAMLAEAPRAAARLLEELDDPRRGNLSNHERATLSALIRLYSGPSSLYLNYYGPPGTIETIPFHELLSDRPTRARDLANRVVFVGESGSPSLTTSDQPDSYPTVFTTADGRALSGAEIGATAFANLWSQGALRPVGRAVTVAGVLGFGVVVGLLARLLPGLYATVSCAAVAIAAAAVAQHLFSHERVLVPLAVPLLVQVPMALFVGLLSRYRDLRRQVPAEVDPHGRQQLFRAVCLATDVKGYTSLTEHLSRDQLHDLLDEYHDMLRRLVVSHGGMVWGRGGDSALCVWKVSAPQSRLRRWLQRTDHEQAHRLAACTAAIEIRDAIDAFNRRHAASQQLPTRMGLDLGEIGLGVVAGELQAVGNPVNTAARIEGLNRHLGTRLLASAIVVDGLDALAVRPLGLFALPGKTEATAIVEIFGARTTLGARYATLSGKFAEALAPFSEGDWAEAARRFRDLQATNPDDGPTGYYLSLSTQFVAARPPSARPVVVAIESK